jgi:hypothetical protein
MYSWIKLSVSLAEGDRPPVILLCAIEANESQDLLYETPCLSLNKTSEPIVEVSRYKFKPNKSQFESVPE